MLLPTEQRTPPCGGDGDTRQEFSVREFTADYYQSGNYKDYLTRSDRYEKMAGELHEFFFRAAGSSEVLDFGCAVGFLVNAFNKLGYHCTGYDKSLWPVEYGTETLGIKNLTTDYNEAIKAVYRWYQAVFVLDVFEHMPLEEVRKVLADLRTHYLVVRIPVCEKDGENFVLEVSRNDPTHITCMSKDSWERLFDDYKYHLVTPLKLSTIWDSPGVLSAIFYRG